MIPRSRDRSAVSAEIEARDSPRNWRAPSNGGDRGISTITCPRGSRRLPDETRDRNCKGESSAASFGSSPPRTRALRNKEPLPQPYPIRSSRPVSGCQACTVAHAAQEPPERKPPPSPAGVSVVELAGGRVASRPLLLQLRRPLAGGGQPVHAGAVVEGGLAARLSLLARPRLRGATWRAGGRRGFCSGGSRRSCSWPRGWAGGRPRPMGAGDRRCPARLLGYGEARSSTWIVRSGHFPERRPVRADFLPGTIMLGLEHRALEHDAQSRRAPRVERLSSPTR